MAALDGAGASGAEGAKGYSTRLLDYGFDTKGASAAAAYAATGLASGAFPRWATRRRRGGAGRGGAGWRWQWRPGAGW